MIDAEKILQDTYPDLKIGKNSGRNAYGITSATGVEFMFVFKAWQQAHSKLRNCCHNAEDRHKGKLVVEVISCTFLLKN